MQMLSSPYAVVQFVAGLVIGLIIDFSGRGLQKKITASIIQTIIRFVG